MVVRGNMESNSPESHELKIEYIRWCLAIGCSIFFCCCTADLINIFYHPNIDGALQLAQALAISPSVSFHPEPKEKAVFLGGLVVCTVCLPFLYYLARVVIDRCSVTFIDRLYPVVVCLTVIFVCSVGYVGFDAQNPFYYNFQNERDLIAETNVQFYFMSTFLYNHFLLYLFVLFPAVTWLALSSQGSADRIAPIRNKDVTVFMYLWCSVLIVTVVLINTFAFPYTAQNKWDFNAVYYSMVQVFNGIPLLIDNFTNTYGLYPHFIAPLFKITGLSIASFSGLMALLTAVCFAMIWSFLQKNLDNTLIVTLSVSSIVFYTHIFQKISTHYDSAFAGQPIRLFFPVLALYLSGLYLKNRSRRTYLLSLCVLSMGILWNPEFGISTYVAFFLFLVYSELEDLNHCVRKIFLHCIIAPVILAATLLLYSLVIKWGYGSYPALPEMFKTLKMFSVIGLNMLEMPLLHPWNVAALTYVLGLSYALFAVVKRTSAARHATVFLVTMLGIATLTYYQGRSHNWALMPTMLYVFMVWGFLADSLIHAAKREKLLLIPCSLMIFALGGSLFQVAFAAPEIFELVHESNNKQMNMNEQEAVMGRVEFIRENTRIGERVLLLADIQHQSLYHTLSGTVSAFNPGLIDLSWNADYDRLLLFVSGNREVKIFVDPEVCNTSWPLVSEMLQEMYRPVKSSGSFILLEKREE